MSIAAKLERFGITPPPEGQTTARTVCPVCSDYRTKRHETCARITITSPTTAKLWCHHCHTEERFSA